MTPIDLTFLNLALLFCILFDRGDGYSVAPNNERLDLSSQENDDDGGVTAAEPSPKVETRHVLQNSNLQLPRIFPVAVTTKNEDVSGTSHGDENKIFRIISREQWNATETETKLPSLRQPAEYVMISETDERCLSQNDCAEQMRKVQKGSMEGSSDQMSSFYIGDDGYVYQGKGWESDGGTSQGGLENVCLWVTFFGRFQHEIPSPTAIETFKALMKESVSSGKLSSSYKLISFRLIFNSNAMLGDMLDDEIRSWDRYTDQIDLYPDQQHRTVGLFPVVFREEWNGSRSNKTPDAVSMPIEHVIVVNDMFRCFKTEACVIEMQDEIQNAYELLGDVRFNFYVGDDGLAYEGRGWDIAPYNPFAKIGNKFIIVSFFGNYDTYPPSRRSLLAFNKLLIFGVWLGKVSPSYNIMSYRSFNDDTFYVGDMLHQELKSMDRFLDDI